MLTVKAPSATATLRCRDSFYCVSPQYAPGEVEGPRYEFWEKAGYFTAESERDAPTFSIVIPPPNVTGSLHIGHALDHTMMDALVRRARMQGYDALWLPGMDHAGIGAQTLVERDLAETEGKSRYDLGREEFVERGLGVEGSAPAGRSSARCAASATAWTGPASGSPWTTGCPAPCRRSSSGSTTTT